MYLAHRQTRYAHTQPRADVDRPAPLADASDRDHVPRGAVRGTNWRRPGPAMTLDRLARRAQDARDNVSDRSPEVRAQVRILPGDTAGGTLLPNAKLVGSSDQQERPNRGAVQATSTNCHCANFGRLLHLTAGLSGQPALAIQADAW